VGGNESVVRRNVVSNLFDLISKNLCIDGMQKGIMSTERRRPACLLYPAARIFLSTARKNNLYSNLHAFSLASSLP